MMFDFPQVRSELGNMTSFPEMFDCVLYVRFVCHPRPTSIFMSLGHRTSNILEDIIQAGNLSQTILWVGGSDRRLSQARHFGLNLTHIVSTFKIIYWETMDVPFSGIRPAPTLFTDRYMREAGIAALNVVKDVSVKSKKKWLLATWGWYQPQLDVSPNCKDRVSAVKWLQTHANESWIDRNKTSPHVYWSRMAEHRFFLSPSGLGVQSPKTFEAIASLTVPICHRSNLAYLRLASEGWPIIIVDSWDWINVYNMSKWWIEYAPFMLYARKCMRKAVLYHNYMNNITMRECIANARQKKRTNNVQKLYVT